MRFVNFRDLCSTSLLIFDLLSTDPATESGESSYLGSHARRSRLTLNHSVVETPIFLPVGTALWRWLGQERLYCAHCQRFYMG